jgi:hypothetical protein
MNWSTLSPASRVNVAALVVAIVAIFVQIAAGVDYPAIPPGPIILAVAAGLVVLTRARWALVVAVIVPLFLTIGGTIAALADDENALRHAGDDLAAFLATAVQMAAVAVAAAAGVGALRARNEGRAPRAPA